MIIVLNTAHEGATLIKVLPKSGGAVEYTHEGEDVVAALQQALEKHAGEMLQGICPIVGAGRFSATRRAVCAANAVALAHNSKAVAIPLEVWDNTAEIIKVFKTASSHFATARYSAPPSITPPT